METLEKPTDQSSLSDQESARKAAAWVPIADDLSQAAAKINAEGPEAERRFATKLAERQAAKEAAQLPPSPPAPPVDHGASAGDNDDMDARINALEAIVKTLATKEDLVRVEGALRENIALTRGALREEMGVLRTEVSRVEGSLRTEISGVETRINKAITDQTWKMIGWTTTICTLLVAAVYFIAKHASN